MTPGVVGRVVLSDPAMLHGSVGPIMLDLHEDGTVAWRPIYPTQPAKRVAFKNRDGSYKTADEIVSEATREGSS
jgi:hypothetical protein